jgi:hypothetical protein
MLRKVVSRFTLGALLVVSVAALAAATGGSAGTPFAYTTQPYLSSDGNGVGCPGFSVNERHYCLAVTTYNNLKKSGGAELDLQLQNFDQSALTNPTTVVTWDNTNVNLSFVSSNPSICSSPTNGEVDCAFPNIPGLGSLAGPNATPNTSSVKLFFTAAASADSVSFKAVANAKESGNDSGGAANVESQTVNPAVMNFDPNTGAGASDATVVLPIEHFNKPHLIATVNGLNSSLDFTSGSPAFIAQFAASTGTACLLNVSCTGLDLNTDLSGAAGGTFSSTNQILWTADVASSTTNIVAVHTYDPVSITPSAPNTLTTPGTRFASCDGVVFTNFGTNPQGNLSTNQPYFVRNATTSNGNTSFQVSLTAKGSLINVTGTGSFLGSCIRIIGDKPASETIKPCSSGSAPPKPATPPALCVAKLNNSTVRAYLWDDANGHLGY